jgi:hypothetical protein
LICTRISKRNDYFTKENDTHTQIFKKKIAVYNRTNAEARKRKSEIIRLKEGKKIMKQ